MWEMGTIQPYHAAAPLLGSKVWGSEEILVRQSRTLQPASQVFPGLLGLTLFDA